MLEGSYVVYMLECADGTLYTGSTNNLEKRLLAHRGEKGGARYTRGRLPVVVRYVENVGMRGAALRREAAIKKLGRAEKLKLCVEAVLPKEGMLPC